MSILCAADGKPVGQNYVHDQLYDLFYCQEHAYLGGQSTARTCLNCGQKVADKVFPEPNCPSCGLNYKETIAKAFQNEVGPVLQRLKNYSFSKAWFSNLIAYGLISTLLYLIFYFADRVIDPIWVAFAILLLFCFALFFSVKVRYYPTALMVLTFPFWFFAELLKVNLVRKEIKMRGGFQTEDRVHSALLTAQAVGSEKYFFLSNNIFIIVLTISTYILKEILSYNILIVLVAASIISIPITIVDIWLYHRVGYPRIEKSILDESRYL